MSDVRRMRVAAWAAREKCERDFRSQHALAGVQIELRFDEKLLGHRRSPQVAADFKGDAVRAGSVGLSDGFDRERVWDDARLEILDRLDHLVLDGGNIEAGCELPAKVGGPEIQHRTADFAELIPMLLFEMGAGIQEPAQIAQHAVAVALKGNDARRPAVLFLIGIFVR